MRRAPRDDLDIGGQRAHHRAERLAEQVGIAHRDLDRGEAVAGRRVDLGLEDHEREIEQQDRTGHAERVGHRIADSGVVVAERRDGRLQGRRAGSRSREETERVAELDVHRLLDREAHDARHEHADQRNQVRPAAVGAREAEEELLAVLNADGIEKEREAERADHRRRRRLGREPAHCERDEQHRPDAERESLDVDLAHEITDRNREKHCHQRLLLK